ncbi:AGAP006350-PA [Anopheles gambiae str. PEST]|uniref:AGAP006350-PA n=1 Tax=Anopheles gambiae TaxID=7165 RepID=Q5TR09_ANOGA|nr:AGAP006350-PA [Anopheles gambiae str. PEST]
MLIILLCIFGTTNAWYETGPWSTSTRRYYATADHQWAEPQFDLSVSRNVTVREGETAFLTCRVENLAKYSISWVRHHDLHILAINADTFTSDERFQALYNDQTAEWTLKLRRTRRKDTDIYECQISTMPVKSLQLYLIVLDYHFLTTTTQILEGTIVYGYKGQNVNLTCIVNHNYDRRPSHIVWYHQKDIVAYESLRKRGRSSLNSITSYHLIRSAEFDDAGNYTCAPELYPSASTIVHILDGRWDGGRDVRWRQCVGAIFNALAVARSLPALLVAFAGEEAQELSSSNRGPWLSALTKLLYGTLVPLSVLYNHRDRMS